MDEGKSWSKPQLVILDRGTPEESILKSCKGGSSPTGAVGKHDTCRGKEGQCAFCYDATTS